MPLYQINIRILVATLPKIMWMAKFNKHVAMYSYTKFKSFCKTSDYQTKFAPQNMTDKDFEKANIKIVTRI